MNARGLYAAVNGLVQLGGRSQCTVQLMRLVTISLCSNLGHACRTPSPAREPAAVAAAPAAAPPAPPAPPAEEVKELSPNEITLRSQNLVEEYLTNKDPKELFLSLQVCRRPMSLIGKCMLLV